MQDLRSLSREINNLCQYLDEIYDINSGGCCYLAYLLASKLEELNLSYSLVVYDYFQKDIEQVRFTSCNKIISRVPAYTITGKGTCDHYCILLEKSIYLNNLLPVSEHEYVITGINSSNIKWIYKKGKWNNNYKRSKNRIIKSIIDDFFKRYKKG